MSHVYYKPEAWLALQRTERLLAPVRVGWASNLGQPSEQTRWEEKDVEIHAEHEECSAGIGRSVLKHLGWSFIIIHMIYLFKI